ncbi:LemA family protein [Chitinophaga parva]|uniref:LemA family protein n=1 Tax=Chitinophaga parva TaxID=2169414 RepID=A0A2T7BJV8_9BACT|nr:LemA family protein [Chitinophaga parva]PUZ27921.1 LemA family protein [Chitinophaga parva]
MKTGSIVAIVLVALLLIAGCGGCAKYNSLVGQDENVKKAWSNVEASYQRRMDLYDNVVSTIKGSANFEQSTLTKVVEARASATQVKIDAENLTPEKLQQFQAAQSQLSSSFGRLLAVAENYPDLKTTKAFQDFQAQIEGTENRINVARRDFNDAVQTYNQSVRYFPGNIVAGLAGFHPKAGFTAQEGADKAPKIDFGDSSK